MATVNKEIADKLVALNGRWPGDAPVVKIVEYENAFDGGLAYGLVYKGENLNRYAPSRFIRNPKTYWEEKE